MNQPPSGPSLETALEIVRASQALRPVVDHIDCLSLAIERLQQHIKMLREACETAENLLADVDRRTEGSWVAGHATLLILQVAINAPMPDQPQGSTP
jgi:hypothetical protein